MSKEQYTLNLMIFSEGFSCLPSGLNNSSFNDNGHEIVIMLYNINDKMKDVNGVPCGTKNDKLYDI